MYSYEQRIKAVELYIQYDCSTASVIDELGYPNYKSLVAWYKQYTESGTLLKEGKSYRKYTAEQRSVAVKHYLEHGGTVKIPVQI